MKLRHLLILGVLLFLNGFVLTVLFLLVSREMARPVATPTEVTTVEPTIQPTFTSTATSSPTEVAPPTSAPVIVPSTPTPTDTPAPPTSTPLPPTPTFTPAPPTPTSPPSSPTPTSAPTATPTPTTTSTHQYLGTEPRYENNCQTTWIEGTVWDLNGLPTAGIRVWCWTYGEFLGEKVTPSDPSKSQGYYEFILHQQAGVPREVVVEVAIVDDNGNLLSPKVMTQTTATDCNNPNGRQRVIVDFVQQY